MTARDAIADWIADVACPLGFEHETGKSDFSYADAILAALDAAGYAVVPKEPTEAMGIAAVVDWQNGKNGGTLQEWLQSAIAAAIRQAAKETT